MCTEQCSRDVSAGAAAAGVAASASIRATVSAAASHAFTANRPMAPIVGLATIMAFISAFTSVSVNGDLRSAAAAWRWRDSWVENSAGDIPRCADQGQTVDRQRSFSQWRMRRKRRLMWRTMGPGLPSTPSTPTPHRRTTPGRLVPDQAKKAGAAQVRRAETLVAAAGAERDAWLLELRSLAPGQESYLTNEIINALNAPAEAAYRELAAAEDAAAAVPARVRPGDLAPAWSDSKPRSSRPPTPSGWLPTTPKPPRPSRLRARLRNAVSRKTTVRLTRSVPRRSGRARHPVPQG